MALSDPAGPGNVRLGAVCRQRHRPRRSWRNGEETMMTNQDVGSGRFPRLFEPFEVGSLRLKNRLVFGPHGSRFMDWHSHTATERQAHYLAERASGGVGLIIQGSVMVHPTGLATAGMNHAWDESCLPGYRVLTEAVHAGGAKIFAQVSHLGRQGHNVANQRELWAPSAIPMPHGSTVPHAMTGRELGEMVDAYTRATALLLEAGFDGIEVYMAHGYLLGSFLSRFSNLRTDAYGGSLENRVRFPTEVATAVRTELGPDTPMGIRISAEEFAGPDGLSVEESSRIVRMLLDRVQIDYIHVSQGNAVSYATLIPNMSYPRTPFVHNAKSIKQVTGRVPVMTVARIVTPEAAEKIVEDGIADLVCLVRPLIADPYWPQKATSGVREDIRECISCNVGCRDAWGRALPIGCLVNPMVGFEEKWPGEDVGRADTPRRVLVVGGGPGGLKAAEISRRRGHEVSLVEERGELGGKVLLAASAMPYRAEFANSVRDLVHQVKKLGVDIETGRRVTAADVAQMGADVVIVATGAVPGLPPIPGSGLPFVLSAEEAIARGVGGHRVVVIDSGEADWMCMTTAERLAADGHDVVLVTPVAQPGAGVDTFSRSDLVKRMAAAGVEFMPNSSVAEILERRLRLENHLSRRESWIEDVDAVVTAWHGVADDGLFHELARSNSYEVHAVGDCLAPRSAIAAIWDGFRVGAAV